MPGREKFSKTIRIDLIPETPSEPVDGKRKRIVVSRAGHHAPSAPVAAAVSDSPDLPYRELLQNFYDAALVTDLSGRIADVNQRALEFLGCDRNELVGMTVFQIISGADASLIDTLCENLENERYTLIQAYCVRKDGSFFPSEIAVNKLNLGEMHLCLFIRDITLRKQAEEMLMTEHNAIQNSGNGIAVADPDAVLEYVNPAMERMWGGAGEELIGRPVRDLMADPAGVDRMMAVVLEEQHSWAGEMLARRVDGREFCAQVAAACNRNRDGEPLGVVLSFVDTTDRKRAEEAIRENERHRVMLETLGAACHHLSQPATVLMGNLEIMEQIEEAGDERFDRLIKSSMDAMHKIGSILHKLNAVNEYKTTPYLATGRGARADESRILDI